MAYRELTMIDVREVLRRWQAGHGFRTIARDTGVDRKTVRRYVDAAARFELPRDRALSDEEVAQVALRVQARPLAARSAQQAVLAEHNAQLAEWLSGPKPLRMSKVHRLLERRGVQVSYRTLARYATAEFGWRAMKPTVRVDDPPPGEEAQVDFAEMGWLVKLGSHERRRLWVLIVTLSVSRYQFVWPTFSQTLESVIEGLEAAWRFFGGVPKRVVIDNMKAVVTKADAQAPSIAEAFAEYAQSRGFFVDPARVRRPRDKARVENQVSYVRESWFAGERMDSIEQARESAAAWCRDVAGQRVHGTTRKVPAEVFEQLEISQLLPLPSTPFDVPRWIESKVHPDHHIQAARALYSLPTRYIGKRVRVRIDSRFVRIYAGCELVKVHPRQPPGGRSTDSSDYPSGKQVYALRSVDALLERAQRIAPFVGAYVERLLDRPLPWTKMRQAYGLLRLCDKYGVGRVDELCRRALAFDVLDVPRIQRMLKAAHHTEREATEGGKLVMLHARFARAPETFGTRAGSSTEEAP